MKIGNTLKNILIFLFLISPFLFIAWVAIFVKPPTLSAKESYQKASEILISQKREAVLTQIYAGSIPKTIHGSVSSRKTAGRGNPWHICFYFKKEDKYIYFVNSSEDEVKEEEEKGRCKNENKTGINIEKWKIDSEKAVEIAKDKAKELGKEEFIIVSIKLWQEKGNVPIWEIEFLPPKVSRETIGLKLTINAETGEIIKTEKPRHSYISV